jgi:[ribosomal protein S18]-alanine N-acetyltransferase
MKICRIIASDMLEVANLESSLERGWSVESVFQEADRPFGWQLAAYGERTVDAIGWCCGFSVGGEAELLRIAVAQPDRSKGVASALLAEFEKICGQQKVSSVFLEVAEKNVAARRLYHKFSYRQVGRRKGYYSHTADDALVMNKTLSR